MADEIPLESRALRQMREAHGWKGYQLAAALGMTPESLYHYEAGDTMTPSPELLELAAAKMGYSEAMVDRTFTYLRLADADLALGASAAGPAHRELRQAAAEMGLLWEEVNVSMGLRAGIRLDAQIERRRAPDLWERLKKHTSAQRRAVYQEDEDYRSWGLMEVLCQKSLDAARDNAQRSLELAEEALFLARLVDVPELFRLRLEGFAGIHVGNATRVGGHLPPAAAAFDEALDRWKAGAPGDPEGLLDEVSRARSRGVAAPRRSDACPRRSTSSSVPSPPTVPAPEQATSWSFGPRLSKRWEGTTRPSLPSSRPCRGSTPFASPGCSGTCARTCWSTWDAWAAPPRPRGRWRTCGRRPSAAATGWT